jgi:hypothetical protein
MTHSRIASLIAIAGLSTAACSDVLTDRSGGAERQSHELSEDGRYIIKYESRSIASSQMQLMAGNLVRELPSIDGVAAYLSDDEVLRMLETPGVVSVEPDRRREIQLEPSTTEQAIPYGIDMVQAPEIWDRVTGEGIKVCVIDSGYDLGHPSLQTDNVDGFPEDWNTDGCGHGTHVTGTIAALDNGEGVLGVIPEGIGLHVVKVFGNNCGWSYSSDLIHAVEQCQAAGAQVVNMSLGGGGSNAAEEQAFQEFYDAGMLIIAAAGNSGSSGYSYPASYDSVVSVAAIDSAMERAGFSTFNDKVEISAPGVGVVSTLPQDGCVMCGGASTYGAADGTSMASPHVAGVAALIWSYNPEWTNTEIREAMNATALDLGEEGRDEFYGYGLVQAKDALYHLIADCTEFGCSDGFECDEESKQCLEIPETLAFYDFDGESKLPIESAEAADAGSLDNRDGDAGFVAGNPGLAIIDNGWRDSDGNFYELTLVPGDDHQLVLTHLAFDERASATGPTNFSVDIIDASTGEIRAAAEGAIERDTWNSQFLALGEAGHGPFQGPVRVRIAASGAGSAQGTWRLDNVHVEGLVHDRQIAPTIETSPVASVQMGQTFTYKVAATGMPSPAISVANLPFWLSFDGVDTISGVAPNFGPGEWGPITVRAANGVNPRDEQSFTVTVTPTAAVPLAGAPMVEDFGTGLPRGWYSFGQWEFGVPTSGPGEAVEGHAVAATNLEGNYQVPTHTILASPVLDFSGMSDAVLRFHSWHSVDECWHGVNVIISTDGGASWALLDPSSVSPAYDGEVQDWGGQGHPMGGQQAWCHDSGGWRAVDIDLEANLDGARDNVMLIFQLGTDNAGPRPGWYIDALRIGSAAQIPVDGAPLQTLALFDFDGQEAAPVQTASGVTVSAIDSRDGGAGYVLGNPGYAITDTGWRDEDQNYFEVEIIPEAGREITFAGLTFDERPSATGPQEFKVLVVTDGLTVSLSEGGGTTNPGRWTSQGVPGDEHFKFSGPVRIRIVGTGGTHHAGTWRIDNVRLAGFVN